MVTFASPLVFPIPDNPNWNFSITNGGQSCLEYREMDAGFTLEVGSQMLSEGPSGSFGIQVECPDGTKYSTDNGLGLLECPDVPGSEYFDTGSSVNFGFLGTSSSPLQLFDCSTAP